MEKVVKTEILEGRWRCTAETGVDESCNHENRGSNLYCEKCNNPRPKDVKFYLPGDARVVTDEDEIARSAAGPDWKCSKCLYDNVATDFHCVHCHTLRDEEEEQKYGIGGDLTVEEYVPNYSSIRRDTTDSSSDKFHTENSSRNFNYQLVLKWGGGVMGIIFIIAMIWYFVFNTRALEVQVSGFQWQRVISIERERTVTESNWDIPIGGRKLYSENRQHGTEQVYDHSDWIDEPVYSKVQTGSEQYECGNVNKGNGYFEKKYCSRPKYERKQTGMRKVEQKIYRDEPVYDIWYTYEINRWYHERTETASRMDHDPYWPEYVLGYRERVESKSEVYTVLLTPVSQDSQDKITSLTHSLSELQWKQIKEGQRFIAEVNRLGGVAQLKSTH